MIIDLIILLVLMLFTFIGYKQGLIKAIIKILSFFIAIILAFTLCNPISNIIIEKTTIDESIESSIVEKVLPEGSSEDENVQLESNFAELLKMDKEGTVKSIAKELSIKIINLATLIIIFIIAKLLLLVLMLFTDLITKIPIIKQFNKLGGTIYGFLKGALLVITVFAVIFVISPMVDESFINQINSSLLGKFIYNNNILINLIL